MIILRTGLVCLLLGGVALAQANQEPVLKPRPNTQVQDLPTPGASATVAPDAPVITINGVCDKSANAASSSGCKTVITKAEFEKLTNSIQPNMAKPVQKQFAARYVTVLVLSKKAHDMGLDKGPEYEQQLQLQKMQLLARLAAENMQKEAAKVSDSEIDEYYKAHSGEFKTISYDRLYVPKQKQLDTTKANDPDAQKKRAATEADMKAEADKLRARAAAGEDFTKLQQEAYDFAGMKLKAANTRVEKVRKTAMPPNDASIFSLKKGDVSQVFDDPQGFMVYKVEDSQDQPLADIRDEVSRVVQSQKMKALSESVQKEATTDTSYNDAYFATPAPPTLRNPGETPRPSLSNPGTTPPTPGKK